MTTTKRYESAEPGTRKWLDSLGFKGCSSVFAANVWVRVQAGAQIDDAVYDEDIAVRAKVAALAPADPFEGLA